MIEGLIKQDETFRHIESGNHYTVLMANHDGDEPKETLLKVPVDVDWADAPKAVVYYSPFISDRIFVRLETDFREKFERIT